MNYESKTCNFDTIVRRFENWCNTLFDRVYCCKTSVLLHDLDTYCQSKTEYNHIKALLSIPLRNTSVDYDLVITRDTIKKVFTVVYETYNAYWSDVSKGHTLSGCKRFNFAQCKQYMYNCLDEISSRQVMTIHNRLCLLALWCDCLELPAEIRANIVYGVGVVPLEYIADYEINKHIVVRIAQDKTCTAWQAIHSRDALIRQFFGDNYTCDIVYQTSQATQILEAKATKVSCGNQTITSNQQVAIQNETINYIRENLFAVSKAEYTTILERINSTRLWTVNDFLALKDYLILKRDDLVWYKAEDVINEGIPERESILSIGVCSAVAENSKSFVNRCEYKQFLLGDDYWVITRVSLLNLQAIVNYLRQCYKKRNKVLHNQGIHVSVMKNKQQQKPLTFAETEILEETTEESIGFVCQPANSENKKSNVNTPLDVLRKLFQ